mmetsp:Transcript_11860/g.13677  ORF Transcript_11860/g.13677 Transcript_11860/m.13677 type:complete len:351 (+) Transcript_11860:155-1207(+)
MSSSSGERRPFYKHWGSASRRKLADMKGLSSSTFARTSEIFAGWKTGPPSSPENNSSSSLELFTNTDPLESTAQSVAAEREEERENEDRFVVSSKPLADGKYSVFAVFDGHGGSECAEWCKNNLLEKLEPMLETVEDENMSVAITKAFKKVDDSFYAWALENDKRMVGATGTVAILKRNDNGTVVDVWVANVGDSHAALITKRKPAKIDPVLEKVSALKRLAPSGVTQLTTNHSAKAEKARIKQIGGHVVYRPEYGNHMVNGKLAVSRAFGVIDMKPYVISAPSIRHRIISPNDKYLCIGTKGLWENVPNEEILEALTSKGMDNGVKELSKIAHERNSDVDATVLCVQIA